MSYVPFGGVWKYSERAAASGPKSTGIGADHARRAVASIEALMLAMDHAVACFNHKRCEHCAAAEDLVAQLRGKS